MRATANADLESLWDLMEEDVIFLFSGKPPMRGREEFAAAFRSMPEGTRVDGISEIHEIQVSGDLAYVWAKLSVRVTPPEGEGGITESGPTLSIFRKGEDGRWRISRDANMLA